MTLVEGHQANDSSSTRRFPHASLWSKAMRVKFSTSPISYPGLAVAIATRQEYGKRKGERYSN
jgi:hypothetical protein